MRASSALMPSRAPHRFLSFAVGNAVQVLKLVYEGIWEYRRSTCHTMVVATFQFSGDASGWTHEDTAAVYSVLGSWDFHLCYMPSLLNR